VHQRTTLRILEVQINEKRNTTIRKALLYDHKSSLVILKEVLVKKIQELGVVGIADVPPSALKSGHGEFSLVMDAVLLEEVPKRAVDLQIRGHIEL
jgi:hypothetical protein